MIRRLVAFLRKPRYIRLDLSEAAARAERRRALTLILDADWLRSTRGYRRPAPKR